VSSAYLERCTQIPRGGKSSVEEQKGSPPTVHPKKSGLHGFRKEIQTEIKKDSSCFLEKGFP